LAQSNALKNIRVRVACPARFERATYALEDAKTLEIHKLNNSLQYRVSYAT
jgi:hypothetical protein